jgi:hypothetical protein
VQGVASETYHENHPELASSSEPSDGQTITFAVAGAIVIYHNRHLTWTRKEFVRSFILLPYHIRSKSSNLSRYFMMLLLIFESSTHVTKSSRFLRAAFSNILHIPEQTYLVTKKAGSVTTSVPTRTCCCSISRAACSRFCAMPSLCITTPSRRLQNADTVTLCSTSLSFPLPPPPVPNIPIYQGVNG